ncbi:MAG: acyl-CoA synthetase [Candidatus Binatia bacterium]|nr:acyl-CoA synthetase [Candidatus Binatia bacterium]
MEFNFADVHETIAASIPDREAFVFRDRRFTHAQFAARTRRLANYLLSRGLTVHTERRELAGHESGQDHVALYLYNGNEYLEGMLASWKARLASFNVNYRYVEEELLYLFENSQARAVIYHAEFAPQIAAIREKLPRLEVLIQVSDDSGNGLLPGAVDYEEALAGSSDGKPDVTPSGDDLYLLYTGGTTGMPKGVLWRSADIFIAAMGGRKPDGVILASYEELAEQVKAMEGMRGLVGPPFMHGAAQWSSMIMMTLGACLVVPDIVKKLDPDDFLTKIGEEKITSITMVGDAFARPLLDQLEKKTYDLSTLFVLGSGGAPLSTKNKEALLEKIPHGMIFDGIGSSETGAQATNTSTKATGATTGKFQPGPGAGVLSEDLSRVLEPGSEDMGWFAQSGRVPLGYFGDPEKTARTFPVVDGARYSVPGDRARHKDDGTIEVLGRDSVTINSGGEKIFAEEVEQALKQHPDVYDTVVTGRASDRWGQEVVAVVQLRADAKTGAAELLEEAAKHIARYKLPKSFVFRPSIVRSPSGKADYRWAKEQAAQS